MRQESRVEGGGQVALAHPLAVARIAPRERPALNDTRRPRAAGARRADDGVAVVHGVAELRSPGQPAAEVVPQFAHDRVAEIGRASCREVVWQYVLASLAAVPFTKKTKNTS